MKPLLLVLTLFTGLNAFAQTLELSKDQNQEKLVLKDLEQIQGHGKKWHSKLKKATTAIRSIPGRQAQNEG